MNPSHRKRIAIGCALVVWTAATGVFAAEPRPQEEVDPLDRIVKVARSGDLSSALEAAERSAGIPIRLNVQELMNIGLTRGNRLEFVSDGRPLRNVLWSITLRSSPEMVWIRRRDAFGRTTAVEIADWRAAHERGDPLPLGPENVGPLLDEVAWGIRGTRPDIARKALRVLARMGPNAAEAVEELEEHAAAWRARTAAEPAGEALGFESVIGSIKVRTLRPYGHYVAEGKTAKPPPPAEWWTRRLSLPPQDWTIDEFAKVAVERTGVPLTIRYDDLAAQWAAPLHRRRFRADDEPLGVVLWRFFLRWETVVIERLDPRGEPIRLEVVSVTGFRKRGERLPSIAVLRPGIIPLLREDAPFGLDSNARTIFELIGREAVAADPELLRAAENDDFLRRLFLKLPPPTIPPEPHPSDRSPRPPDAAHRAAEP